MVAEYKLVQQCLRRIEDNLGWGPSHEWHNDMFVELSEKIQKQTQVLLSPTTLKRLWGRVDYKSAPSITTLNTLAQYAGFQNWRDFKNQTKTKKPSWVSRKVNPNLGIIMLAASVMTLVFISLYSLTGSKNNIASLDVSKIGFTSRPLSNGLPNSVVFDLDIDEIQSDSIHIQQYWDPTKTIKLSPGQKQATGQYYLPGYFRAKLMVDGTPIKQHDLFIKSNGWLGTLNYDPIPKYIMEEELRNGTLSFPANIVQEITASDRPLSTTFHKVEDFAAISGDNFVLNTRIKNTYHEKWAVCQNTSIAILGTKSALVIGLSIPGCVSEIGVMMSEVYVDGKENDLSGLGVDFSSGRNLSIEVRNKRLGVFLESDELFSGSYTQSIGNIIGMRIQFLGTGEIFHVKLTDLSGDTVVLDHQFE